MMFLTTRGRKLLDSVPFRKALPDGGRRPVPTSLTVAEVADVLSNERRLLVLAYLDGADGQVTLPELTEHVTMKEHGYDSPHQMSASERKNVYVGLYQSHIPALRDAGVVVTPNGSSREVAPGPEFDAAVAGMRSLVEAFDSTGAGVTDA